MAKIKKAFLLSSSAILLVLIIVVTLSINNQDTANESRLAATNIRIKILNSFVNDLESNYFEKILHVSGKYSLELLSEYKFHGGSAPSSSSSSFDNDFSNVLSYGMAGEAENRSLAAFMDKAGIIFNNSGVNITKLNAKISSIRHNNPWAIDVAVQFEYNIEDKGHIASWEGSAKKNVSLSITGLKDPAAGETIVRDGASRWVQHGDSQLATHGDSFLRRLDSSQPPNYGICKEDDRHCGTCDNDCTIQGKSCSVGIGTCHP